MCSSTIQPQDFEQRKKNLLQAYAAAWESGQPPSLEDYLQGSQDPQRSELLHALLDVELEFRRRRGETTDPLEHPGIVPVYALDYDEYGKPYYVMRFIAGKTHPLSDVA